MSWKKIRVKVAYDSNGSKILRADGDYSKKDYADLRYAIIDLNEYDIDLVIDLAKTPSQICKKYNAELGGNCCFAWKDNQSIYHPIGNIVKNEKLIQTTKSAEEWADFILPKNGLPYIGQININDTKGIKLGFTGTPQIVKDGKIFINSFKEDTPKDIKNNKRHKTGLGITKDGKVIYAVLDYSEWDASFRIDEFALIMIYLGAYQALNLDGGGSSSFVVNGKPENYQARKIYERPTSTALIFKKKNSSKQENNKLEIIDSKLSFKTNLQTNKNTHEWIIIHHALAKKCTVWDIHKWHLNKNWIGIGYHFFISKDGKIYKGREINWQGAHCKEQLMNIKSIGICLEGCYEDYSNQTDKEVPVAQLKALEKLVKYLMELYNVPINKVVKHHYFANYKKCCGNYFPWDLFIANLKEDKDVSEQPSEWAKKAWEKAIKKGIIDGVNPQGQITREMLIQILDNMKLLD